MRAISVVLAMLVGCSGESTESSTPIIDVAFPGSFPVTETTQAGYADVYEVTGLTAGTGYTVSVRSTSVEPDTEDDVFVDVEKDIEDFGPENQLCTGTRTEEGSVCTFTATAANAFIVVTKGFTDETMIEYTLGMSAGP